MAIRKRREWLKERGYLHLTNRIKLRGEGSKWNKSKFKRLKHSFRSISYIAQYAFFPLLHYKDVQRRYKKQALTINGKKTYKRRHSEAEKNKSTAKIRPIHYATHIDANIYSYYGYLLSTIYEKTLEGNHELDKAILAYRYIPIEKESTKGKSSIHFAKETFDEIKGITEKNGSCVVLTFDIEKFFSSLHHQRLKNIWYCFLQKGNKIIDNRQLPPDHYNVFKSVTKFSYIEIENLKTANFIDEKRLHKIRQEGVQAFFKNAQEFRKAIQSGKLQIRKNQFFYKNPKTQRNEPCGIPQGLPISAVLANMYLYYFDLKILKFLSQYQDTIYRRYSDDILIICNTNNSNEIQSKVEQLIKLQKLKISTDKTEKFTFNKVQDTIYVTKYDKYLEKCFLDVPLLYLGFEYYGYKSLIKAASISKYYRRLQQAINSKKRVIERLKEKHNTDTVSIHLNTFKKLLSIRKCVSKAIKRKNSKKDDKYGYFPHYVYKAYKVFKDKNMLRQIRRRYKFFYERIKSIQNN